MSRESTWKIADRRALASAGALAVLFLLASRADAQIATIVEPEVDVEEPALFRASIAGSLGGVDEIAIAQLSFRRGGDPDFFSIAMQRGEDDWFTAVVPAFVVSERGVDYFVSARDTFGREMREPSVGHFSLPVSIPNGFSLPVPSGTEEDGFRLLSIPATLDTPWADSVFFEDFGPYDPTAWKLFAQSDLGNIVELGGTSTILLEPGNPFWLLGREGDREFSTGRATSVTTAEPFRVIMRPGWNLVANPFPFPVPIDQVISEDRRDNPEDGPIDRRAYLDGVWRTDRSPWASFEGYAVFNLAGLADTLIFYSDPSQVPVATASKRTDYAGWAVSISARKGRARDTDNVALVAPSASSGWDRLDKPEPPVIGDYVSVSFEGERYPLSTDARRDAGTPWTLLVRSATQGIVDLTFDLPREAEAYLLDPVTGTSRDVRRGYQVVSPGRGTSRRLELHIGPAPEDSAPSDFGLDPIFPNPSNGPVTLVYRLPEAGAAQLVVYDLLGRRVSVVSRESAKPGIYSMAWDVSDLPPGTYILELRAGTRAQFRTMTVVR
jgi:type IX secretion system substrate protein